MKPLRCRKHAMRGLALVEFAIGFPILLLILIGGAELSHALYQFNTLTKAVEGGTRYLAGVALAPSSGVIELTGPKIRTTRNLVVFGHPADATTPVLPGFTTAQVAVDEADDEHVVVTAQYSYVPVIGIIPGFGYGEDVAMPATFTAAVTMRAL